MGVENGPREQPEVSMVHRFILYQESMQNFYTIFTVVIYSSLLPMQFVGE